jgi:hypothetical protein
MPKPGLGSGTALISSGNPMQGRTIGLTVMV